ncbi:beta-ketoacyl-ACP synthase II [bacterium]|nr:beta-ketoacyl-ACP synthase II [bacterium]
MEKRRVVVTGAGCVSPYGVGAELAWNSVIDGKSCIKKLVNISDVQKIRIGGEVVDLDAEKYVKPKEAKRIDDFILFAYVASQEAYKNSLLDMSKENPYEVGVLIGSGQGGTGTTLSNFQMTQKRGEFKCSPFAVPMMIPNMAAGRVSLMLGAKGLNKSVSSACATGAHAIGDAFRSIQYGDADVMFAGGSEKSIIDFVIGTFNSAKTLSTSRNDEPEKASRPYDKDRDGFVMSEGATILVLEELEHAKKRGANILAELVGYGQSGDAYDIVAPDPSGAGAEMAVKKALADAGITSSDVDYINAHGTSTYLGDIAESKMIERVFGDKETNKSLLVSSTKSMTGHLLGAAGAIEAFFALKAAKENIVPPTINLCNVDEEVGNLDYVPNKAREHSVKYSMSNSFGFGGTNAVLIFKKYEV